MHAAGVELDDAFLVGQAAEAHAVVVGVVFRAGDDGDGGFQRVGARGEQGVGAVQIGEAVIGADDDGGVKRGGRWRLCGERACVGGQYGGAGGGAK